MDSAQFQISVISFLTSLLFAIFSSIYFHWLKLDITSVVCVLSGAFLYLYLILFVKTRQK
jgi:hypothetical protein